MTGERAPVNPWLLAHLVCPADHGVLRATATALECEQGHRFPVIDGVPVMLLHDCPVTMGGSDVSLQSAWMGPADARAPQWYLETLGISEEEKHGVVALAARGAAVDPVVAYLVAATNGLMYRHLIGTLDRYPIPSLPLPPGGGRLLLDVGCSWGRWSIAANRAGYEAVGLDPSLGAVMAARRVARQLGASNHYVVGDARHLPFAAGQFHAAFSYSVIQHLSKDDAGAAVAEIGRVLREGGTAKVQMPTRFGLRCLYHQARRGFREGAGFEVRYWSIPELLDLFNARVGPTRLTADCYFAIGLQPGDAELLTPGLRRVVRLSEWLKSVSTRVPALVFAADSVFAESVARPVHR